MEPPREEQPSHQAAIEEEIERRRRQGEPAGIIQQGDHTEQQATRRNQGLYLFSIPCRHNMAPNGGEIPLSDYPRSEGLKGLAAKVRGLSRFQTQLQFRTRIPSCQHSFGRI
jgi:hypothetical protein